MQREESATEQRQAWFIHDRFGLFIHWGIYACAARHGDRTTQSEFAAPPDCRFTQRGDRLYLHIFSWPLKSIHLPELAGRVAYAQLLND